MCCFFVALLAFGPRLGFLVYWIFAPARVNLVFSNFNFPWLVGIAGLLFIPWTTLMYTIVYPLDGWDWLWIGLALAVDIAAYAGGAYKRKNVPGYPSTAP